MMTDPDWTRWVNNPAGFRWSCDGRERWKPPGYGTDPGTDISAGTSVPPPVAQLPRSGLAESRCSGVVAKALSLLELRE